MQVFWKRENVLSRAGRKGVIYAINQELPHHIFNENSVHSITQDCSSNKTKIIKHALFRSPYLKKQQQHRHQHNASSPLTNGTKKKNFKTTNTNIKQKPRARVGFRSFSLHISQSETFKLISLFLLIIMVLLSTWKPRFYRNS